MHPRYLAQSLWTMHKTQPRDFPGSAVVKNTLSVQGAQVLSLVEELRSCMLPGMANHHPQPCHRPTKTKNSKQKQTAKQTDKKPSPNACYGSVVFQRNHCLLLPGILKLVFIDTGYMPGTLHHNILGCFYYSHPPEEEMKVQRHGQGPIAAK